jgi:hypothetical protein
MRRSGELAISTPGMMAMLIAKKTARGRNGAMADGLQSRSRNRAPETKSADKRGNSWVIQEIATEKHIEQNDESISRSSRASTD